MISEKNYDISFSPSKVFMSDNPIRSKLYCRVFIDKIGEGTWEVVNENEYDVINDSIVFSEFPIGKFLSMQVSTTPAELMQSPTENTIIVSIKNEIKEVVDVASSIITVADNIANVNNVGNNIIKVNTVADNITNVNLVGNNILDVNTVGNNITKVQIVSDDIVNVDVVADNITKVNTVSSDINKVIILADNITDVDVVASNILDIQTIADNVVDIQNAEENANSALLSKNLAEKWASELEDVPISDGKYSAYHWALKAFDLVYNGIIDDITPSSIKTYSSNKIEVIIDTLDLSKQDVLVSGTNIKTINNSSILTVGNLDIYTKNETDTRLGLKANTADLKEIGVGQTWQNVTGSKVNNVNYQNTTGKPIFISCECAVTGTSLQATLTIDGLEIQAYIISGFTNNTVRQSVCGVIPVGSIYKVYTSGGILVWNELR